ncbi:MULTISPECIES: NUDIX domain-containing protein [unclassified Streptomyces]|uniref:NUDIX domain-containing protein n=1 Tax=unclassified Streptomyces TaxID=2593676 RepID=UPI0011650D0D|nr:MULTISPECIES: NUDIX domain-containing protein [unclassified Streptomyces]QDN90140.1 NUDIX domain-containing protein [Streptomyces sp. RLB3-6]QDO10987.1 NUDIX domain-containing protein [Streptomyces sp. S1D4-23]
MSRRTDYFNDPAAPKANSIVPAVTAFVVNDAGDVLLEQRSDNGRWGMPGGVQEVGENIAGTVAREVLEETGIHVEVVGLVGIFTDPGHVIAFANGEVRQEFSLCFRARPLGGEIKVSSESFAVRWVSRAELDSLDVSPTTRRRLEEGFRNAEVPLIS